jgi:hypothetical protein
MGEGLKAGDTGVAGEVEAGQVASGVGSVEEKIIILDKGEER